MITSARRYVFRRRIYGTNMSRVAYISSGKQPLPFVRDDVTTSTTKIPGNISARKNTIILIGRFLERDAVATSYGAFSHVSRTCGVINRNPICESSTKTPSNAHLISRTLRHKRNYVTKQNALANLRGASTFARRFSKRKTAVPAV